MIEQQYLQTMEKIQVKQHQPIQVALMVVQVIIVEVIIVVLIIQIIVEQIQVRKILVVLIQMGRIRQVQKIVRVREQIILM